MTTNLGAADADRNVIGFGSTSNDYEDKELKKFFAPEFRNRLDGIITFGKLTKETMVKVIGKFLVELKAQVKDKGINISITDEAIDYLVDKGFDSKMGARPLQRVIDKDIKRPLSRQMLFGPLKNGGTVVIDIANDLIDLRIKTENAYEENQ
jgi:ATP-dependent Clp protease ATP-binding subunit ClpA